MVDFNPTQLTHQTGMQKAMEQLKGTSAPIRFALDGKSYTVKPSVVKSSVPSRYDLNRDMKASVMTNGQPGMPEARSFTPVEITISGQKGKSEGLMDAAGMLYVKLGDVNANPGEGGIQIWDHEFGTTNSDKVVGSYGLIGQVPTEEVGEAMTNATEIVDRYEASSRRERVETGAANLTEEAKAKEKGAAEALAKANKRPGLIRTIINAWNRIVENFAAPLGMAGK